MPGAIDSGSPAGVEAELTQHAAWLRRLASDLVGSAGADDLVQRTYVAALTSPPASDRPLRPWLSAVLRNTWRMGRRSQVRRERRETAAASTPVEPAPDAEALVARSQSLRQVGELLESLDDPYRTTLLLRYLEDVPVAAIAEREGIKAGTVRWRIKTGLDMLRDELDARHGGDRAAWVGALVPLVVPRGVPSAAATAGATTVKLSTKSIIIVFTLAIAVGATGTLLAQSDDEAGSEPSPATTPEPTRASARTAAAVEPIRREAARDAGPAKRVRRFASPAERALRMARLDEARRSAAPAEADDAPAGDPEPTPDDPSFAKQVSALMGAPEVVPEFLLPALSECLDGLPEPGKGHLTLQMMVTGAPDIGTLIESAELDEDLSSSLPEDVVECAIQTGYALDIPAPPVPGSARIDLTMGFDTRTHDLFARIGTATPDTARRRQFVELDDNGDPVVYEKPDRE